MLNDSLIHLTSLDHTVQSSIPFTMFDLHGKKSRAQGSIVSFAPVISWLYQITAAWETKGSSSGPLSITQLAEESRTIGKDLIVKGLEDRESRQDVSDERGFHFKISRGTE